MAESVGLGGYYAHFPESNELAASGRFPRNHVRFPAKLKPLEWLNALHVRTGRGLSMEAAILAAFDGAAPYDTCLGTPEELQILRSVLATMVRGLDQNPNLLGIGRLLVKQFAIHYLTGRNAVLQYYAANKTFIESHGKIQAPLIITGLPRTGSTLLQRLLAEDPDSRSPLTFEMEAPLPPMPRDSDPLSDSRIAQASSSLTELSRIAPGFIEKLSESHLWSATEYEESYLYMLGHNGLSVMNAPDAGESYVTALTGAGCHGPVMRYERLFFTMLDAYRPARSHWVLKAPTYALALPFVFNEYPDARIVITHRNPLITMPSLCRLMESWCIAFNRDGCFDKYRFAELVMKFMIPFFSLPFQYRRTHPEKESQILDVMYDELFSDPVAMVRRIYDFSGLRVTTAFEERMRRYLDNNRQGKYGRHRYSLEEYGIDAEAFVDEHADYMSKYNFGLQNVSAAASSAMPSS